MGVCLCKKTPVHPLKSNIEPETLLTTKIRPNKESVLEEQGNFNKKLKFYLIQNLISNRQ